MIGMNGVVAGTWSAFGSRSTPFDDLEETT